MGIVDVKCPFKHRNETIVSLRSAYERYMLNAELRNVASQHIRCGEGKMLCFRLTYVTVYGKM